MSIPPSTPFTGFFDFLYSTDRFLRLYVEGLNTQSRSHSSKWSGVFADWLASQPLENSFRKLTSALDHQAELAQVELELGMPLLLPQMVVGAWGAFESAMDEFLASRGYAGGVNIPKKTSITDRYNILLCSVGLTGDIETALDRALTEMYGMRNLIVHHSSRVDQQFKNMCPWLDYDLGVRLVIEQLDWKRYHESLLAFIAIIGDRVEGQTDPEITRRVSEIVESSRAAETNKN